MVTIANEWEKFTKCKIPDDLAYTVEDHAFIIEK